MCTRTACCMCLKRETFQWYDAGSPYDKENYNNLDTLWKHRGYIIINIEAMEY